MASLNKVNPPERLELGCNATEKWQLFKQRWANYVTITELNSTNNRDKLKPMFLHCLNDDALRAYNSFQLSEDASIETVIQKFDDFIIGEINVTYERYIFNKRIQAEGETFELFHAEAQRLMNNCKYCDNCRESILRDKIIVGINDKCLQKDLLKVRDLNLKQCIDMCRAHESANKQNMQMKSETVHKIQKYTKNFHKNLKTCKFCGKKHEFVKEKCPAFGKTCGKCNKKNHFAAMCSSSSNSETRNEKRKPKKLFKHKKVNLIEEDNSDYEEEWINAVTDKISKQVKCIMIINKKNVTFQVDKGSSVNIIPKEYVYSEKLNITNTVLKTWNNDNYKPLGECRLSVKNPKNGRKYNVNFVVSDNDLMPILGLKASIHMNLIKVQDSNFEMVNNVCEEYADVFDENRLGLIKGDVNLKLEYGSKPVIMANRKCPVSLRQPLKDELDRLIKLDVIKPIEEPTPWCSQVVVSPKKNGKIRLCLDPQELNKVLQRERYSLPILDDVLHELRQATVFSKADLSSGYWHLKLDEESSKLTTFQTCFGRYRWVRLPFGLSVSAEIFQKRLNSVFENLPGIVCIADDVIIHGKNDEEHDLNMKIFLDKCKTSGIQLNKAKFEHKVSSLTFMGHKVTKDGLQVDTEKIKAIEKFPKPSNGDLLKLVTFRDNLVTFRDNCSATIRFTCQHRSN